MPPQMRRTSVSQSDTLKFPRFISGNLSEIEGPRGTCPMGKHPKQSITQALQSSGPNSKNKCRKGGRI